MYSECYLIVKTIRVGFFLLSASTLALINRFVRYCMFKIMSTSSLELFGGS